MADAQPNLVLLAGASGLVGGYALDALLQSSDVSRVIALSRLPLRREHPRLANRIVQFERIETQLQGTKCDVALSCLGTTLRAAGSEQAFRAVDVGYVLAFARVARAAGARRFEVVSSVGADAASRNFYLRTKGEMEKGLEALGFESLDILQPSMLLGWRRDIRPLELAAAAVMPLVNPFLMGKYLPFRGIAARTVAAALLGAMRSGRRGVQRYEYPGLLALARQGAPLVSKSAPPQARAGAR
ncbi:MAG TPA: NAD-dependent epimerase/dehydratase family protein [Steroidobacteraceae bacterium]|nr:NAD-dependent epimerase/dehydratase family protein [Steroidobacteraceae bacterium]